MSAVGRRSGGLNDIDLVEINDFANSSHFTELEKAVLQLATEMTNTPVRVSDDNFEVLKQNFNSKQLVELASNIAWENYRARYDHSFGIESAEFAEDVAK